MLFTLLYYAILSTCIIVISHVLWKQFSETVIVAKPHSAPSKKYQKIIQELQSPPSNIQTGFISDEEKQAMMEELQSLLQ